MIDLHLNENLEFSSLQSNIVRPSAFAEPSKILSVTRIDDLKKLSNESDLMKT